MIGGGMRKAWPSPSLFPPPWEVKELLTHVMSIECHMLGQGDVWGRRGKSLTLSLSHWGLR